MNPKSVEELAEAMRKVWTDASLRKQLADRGRARLALYTPADFGARLTRILREGLSIIDSMEAS